MNDGSISNRLAAVAAILAGILGGFAFAAAAGDEVPVVVAAVIGGLSLVAAILAAVPMVRKAPGGASLTHRSAPASTSHPAHHGG